MFKKNKISNKITEENLKERIQKTLRIAWSYGQIDGDNHKMWVIDQMVRTLCGSNKEYQKWIDAYEMPEGYEESHYKWNVGIKP